MHSHNMVANLANKRKTTNVYKCWKNLSSGFFRILKKFVRWLNSFIDYYSWQNYTIDYMTDFLKFKYVYKHIHTHKYTIKLIQAKQSAYVYWVYCK